MRSGAQVLRSGHPQRVPCDPLRAIVEPEIIVHDRDELLLAKLQAWLLGRVSGTLGLLRVRELLFCVRFSGYVKR